MSDLPDAAVGDLPDAYVVHSVAGRTRIRIPQRRDAAYFAMVRERLRRCSGVSAVDANPTTGSVVIHHANRLDRLGSFAADNQLFALRRERDLPVTAASNPATLPAPSSDRITLAPQVWPTSGNLSDPRVLGWAALWGFGLVQLLRGQMLPPAVSLFWYGINALFLPTMQRRPEMPAGNVHP